MRYGNFKFVQINMKHLLYTQTLSRSVEESAEFYVISWF